MKKLEKNLNNLNNLGNPTMYNIREPNNFSKQKFFFLLIFVFLFYFVMDSLSTWLILQAGFKDLNPFVYTDNIFFFLLMKIIIITIMIYLAYRWKTYIPLWSMIIFGYLASFSNFWLLQ